MLQSNPSSVIVGTGTGVTAYTELEWCQVGSGQARVIELSSRVLEQSRQP